MKFFKQLFQKPQTNSIAIVAIFKNEKDYILEWLAWHHSQGFKDFIIYDNDSDDGTTELLKQLASKNLIEYHFIPKQEAPQLVAYQHALQTYKRSFEILGFIDADEFLISEDDTTAHQQIIDIFSDPSVGALGINWRVIGSSGHIKKPNGFVVENFNMAAIDNAPRNHFIKSFCRTSVAIKALVHNAKIKKSFRYVNARGENIKFSKLDTLPSVNENNKSTGLSHQVCQENLRLNHYAVKSHEEFIAKKQYRGRAASKGDQLNFKAYLQKFDLNDQQYQIPQHLLDHFYRAHKAIKTTLSETL